jgi:hypothetical protein
MECVIHNWAGILVGPAGSGKSSVIANLGCLSGHNVVEIQMHRGMDISDLLGGFEQQDKFRDAQFLIEQVSQLVRHLAFYCSQSELGLEHIRVLWEQILDCKEHDPVLTAVLITKESSMECLKKMIGFLGDAHRTEAQILFDSICQLAGKLSLLKGCAGKFEWVDGTLTRCILDGSWVILRDANLCSPSLLDRLNSLLEPGGYLALNECCTEIDGARMIQPHENFRLFITYDPSFGEISRAMKNRGIELYFPMNTYVDGDCQGRALKGGHRDLSNLPGLLSFPGVNSEIIHKWIQRFFEPFNKCDVDMCLPGNCQVPMLMPSVTKVCLFFHRKMPTLEIFLSYFEVFSGLLLVGSSLKQTIFDFVDRVLLIEPLHLNSLKVFSSKNPRLGEQNSIFFYPSIASMSDNSLSAKLLSDLMFLMEVLNPFIQHNIKEVDVEVNTDVNQIHPFVLYSLRSIFNESFHTKQDVRRSKDDINAMRYFHTRFGFSLQIYAESCTGNAHCVTEVEKLLESLITYFKSFKNFGESTNRLLEINSAMLRIPFTEWMQRYGTEMLSKMVALELIELRILTVFETLPSDFNNCFSILECSAWVRKNPHARNTRLVNCGMLEWVWPTLQAIVAKAKEQEDFAKVDDQVGFQIQQKSIDYVHGTNSEIYAYAGNSFSRLALAVS